jgi:hypothetical protein
MSKEKKVTKEYEPPKVITFSEGEILEEMGPAQACTAYPGCPVEPPG